mmetsp:Transcript_18188/g.43548  ORF Transcript_18188/g.43548 Transcript_18188/m.43548 type:complete len:252 (+) Transcript_18188:1787-2542(+)
MRPRPASVFGARSVAAAGLHCCRLYGPPGRLQAGRSQQAPPECDARGCCDRRFPCRCARSRSDPTRGGGPLPDGPGHKARRRAARRGVSAPEGAPQQPGAEPRDAPEAHCPRRAAHGGRGHRQGGRAQHRRHGHELGVGEPHDCDDVRGAAQAAPPGRDRHVTAEAAEAPPASGARLLVRRWRGQARGSAVDRRPEQRRAGRDPHQEAPEEAAKAVTSDSVGVPRARESDAAFPWRRVGAGQGELSPLGCP